MTPLPLSSAKAGYLLSLSSAPGSSEPSPYTICNLSANRRSSPQTHLHDLYRFENTWYRFPLFYGLIAVCLNRVLNIQTVLAIAWVVLTKWLTIGRRLRLGQVQLLQVPFWVLLTYTFTKSSYGPARSVALVSVKIAQQGIR